MMFFYLILIACEEKEQPNNTLSPSSECSEFSMNECSSQEGCSLLYATPRVFDSENECYENGEQQPVSCTDSVQNCASVETWAAPPDDPSACHWFNSGCIPDGWSDCAAEEYLDCSLSNPECSELTISECREDDNCQVLEGHVLDFDQSNECYDPETTLQLDCMNINAECAGVVTFAAPSDGFQPEDCHLFFSDCIPNGWVYCDGLNDYGECE